MKKSLFMSLNKISKKTLLQLKWVTFCVILTGLVGTFLALGFVLVIEQDGSGRYAEYTECKYWDEGCLHKCESVSYDSYEAGPSCNDCCLNYGKVYQTLGNRLSELGLRAFIIGCGVGITVGLVVAEDKSKRINEDS